MVSTPELAKFISIVINSTNAIMGPKHQILNILTSEKIIKFYKML